MHRDEIVSIFKEEGSCVENMNTTAAWGLGGEARTLFPNKNYISEILK